MKFIVDGMLGKLARWLRMLGYDVEYSTSLDDLELLKMSKKENRTLLTRDFELYKQAIGKGIEAFYVEGDTGEKKLAELAKRYEITLDIDMSTSRCPKCNTPVIPVPKSKIMEKVEKSTLEHYNDFWQCPKCGQIYWQGAHWVKIRETLTRVNELLET